MRTIVLATLVLVLLGSCKKKSEAVPDTKMSAPVGYAFKGLVHVGYDATGKVHWVSYSYPGDYTWASDLLDIKSNNTFLGYGGGSYTTKGDTSVISETNWPAATDYGYDVKQGVSITSGSVNLLYCDTVLNLSSFGSNLYAAYATGLSPNPNDLAPKHLRLFLFQK